MFLLSSCSLLPEPNDIPDRFLLESIPPSSASKRAKKSAIIIDTPSVYTPLDNTRIALLPTANTIDYIADIEWGDRLSVLVHESLIQSFQNAALFESVGRLNTGLQAKYLVTVDVREFFRRCCDHKAVATYFVQVFSLSDRKSLNSKLFSQAVSIPDDKAVTVPLSLNQAHKKVVADILSWLEKVID